MAKTAAGPGISGAEGAPSPESLFLAHFDPRPDRHRPCGGRGGACLLAPLPPGVGQIQPGFVQLVFINWKSGNITSPSEHFTSARLADVGSHVPVNRM